MRISQKARDLIVQFEVSSQKLYERRYRSTIWPGVSSGVTIGIGYDVGYVTPEKLRRDWSGRIPERMIDKMVVACGVRGAAAKPLAASLKPHVDIPWEAAIGVFDAVKIPEFEAKTEKAFPGCFDLPPDCLGALVSLVFNRGELVNTTDRRREMLAIRNHVKAKNYHLIPDEFRKMKRLWPTTQGLRDRRDREASLFKQGLQAAGLA